MADDKKGRNKQADDEERRQRERELQEARDRGDEPEPIDAALEDYEYPTTADELVSDHSDREVETRDGSKRLEDVFAPVDDESYDSADEVRDRIRELTDR